jgi:S1/P1 Nuclease
MLLTLLATPTLAWWDEGHILVARISEQNVQNSTQEKLKWLLSHHPDPCVKTLSDAAIWPDVIKNEAHPFHDQVRSDWHFQNRAVGDPARAVKDTGKLVEQIHRQVSDLANRRLPPSERAIALCWVVHLIGDIHQPLHNTNLYNETFPKGDRGGNDFLILLGTKPLPLHMLWDSVGGRFLEPVSAIRQASYLRWFQEDCPPESLAQELSVMDAQTWSDEGLELSRSDVYPGLSPGVGMPPDRLQSALDISKVRVTLAGYRLAKVLDACLRPTRE